MPVALPQHGFDSHRDASVFQPSRFPRREGDVANNAEQVGIIFPLQSFGSLCCGHGPEFGRRVKGSTPIQQQSCRWNYCSIWSRAFRKCMQSVVQRLARSPLSRKRAPGNDPTFARNYYIRIVVSMCCHRGVSYLKARLRGLPLGVK